MLDVERSLPSLKNFCAQTPAAFQEFVRTRREGAIHPIARPAFFHAVKTDTLHFEVLADQFVEIDTASNHVASRTSRRSSRIRSTAQSSPKTSSEKNVI